MTANQKESAYLLDRIEVDVAVRLPFNKKLRRRLQLDAVDRAFLLRIFIHKERDEMILLRLK